MNGLTRVIAIVAILIAATGCSAIAGMLAPASEAQPAAISEAIELALTATPEQACTPNSAPDTEVTKLPATEAAFDDVTSITLGDDISVDGPGVSVDGSVISITSGGSYLVQGMLADGQIVVDYSEKESIELMLDGASITSSSGSPIAIMDAKDATIVLMEGSENLLADSDSYVLAAGEDEPNATLYSKSDLVIGGTGSLTIEANYAHGINGKDDLEIVGGTIVVDAVADGIRGKDSLTVTNGDITVVAGQDGVKANNDEDPDKGIVVVHGGTLTITAGEDGIQAETSILVETGSLDITTAGGAGDLVQSPSAGGRGGVTNVPDDISAKGLKAGVSVHISGGQVTVNALDDAIHSDDSLTVSGGTLVLRSGDDGLHADNSLAINGGNITIARSYEGIESDAITISDGTVHVVSNDDGISGSGSNARVDITGGYMAIDSLGDGLDANGSATMSGGVLIVSGPISSMNGALDADRGFVVSGGVIVGASAFGMAQAPATTSSQYSLMINLALSQPAGTPLAVADSDGQLLVSIAPEKAYQSVVISSPEISKGTTYTAYTGGSATGQLVDGVYLDAAYTRGTEAGSVEVDGAVSVIGNAQRMGPGGGGRPPRPGR